MDLCGIGLDKILVLFNGEWVVNNVVVVLVFDFNMILFVVIECIEVLCDGVFVLYGIDVVGGVINFIMKKSYIGVIVMLGYDKFWNVGGIVRNGSIGFGFGDLVS